MGREHRAWSGEQGTGIRGQGLRSMVQGARYKV